MIKIKFFSSFGSNEGCIEAYTRVSELEKDPDFNTKYCFVTGDDYTHVVILNTAMPQLLNNIPKENVVGLAFEPVKFLGLSKNFIEYAQKYIGKYYIGEKHVSFPNTPFEEHFGYMWHLTPLKEKPVKKNIMSIMISEKNSAEGHKYRHVLCQHILRTNLPIDIYGKGCKFYSFLKDTRLKGDFKETEPYLNYVYHIAIENFKTPHYFSEKIMNTLLCSTVPLYLGCQNIDSYFPNQVVHLSENIEKDMQLLREICENPEKHKKNINEEEVKKRISFSHLIHTKLGWC
jgi:hypothetical protein